ncbi:hypothetical protein GQR58_003165 [Nymphon striatum]|nr:hypothetical protein GQR58_003165 [Nymphon striatum]
MFDMSNQGSVGFLLSDRSQAASSQWQFASQPNEAFAASFIETGGSEFQVGKDGAVQMGPGATVNFALSSTGHMTLLHGTATATQHITSSSREVKKDFKKVDSEEVLNKIKNLEVTEWRYKDEDVEGRHLGPMAEDFYQLFKLGPDDKHVSATDMASVAIIAAQELQKKADAITAESSVLKQETAKLKAENESLKQRLVSLEKLVTSLASADGSLNPQGEKVALSGQ